MTQINMYSSKEEIDAMTNKQAAEIISKFCSSSGNNDFSPRPHMAKANQLAVRALYKIDKLLEENTNLKKTMKIYKKNKKIGVYPCIDHLNLALKFLLEDAKLNIKAIEEICYAIEKANGYYYDYVLEMLIERGIKNKQFH